MSVQAKFQCSEKTEVDGYYGKGNNLLFHVVTNTDENAEDKRFFNSTPTGQIHLYCVNPEANIQFEVGKKYYVTFTEAE